MPQAPDEDMVHKWNDLMAKWEAASQQYEKAATLASLPGHEADHGLQEALFKSIEELKDLKRQIDQTIRRGKQGRLHLPGTLVVGTLEQSEHKEDRDGPANLKKPVRLERDQH